MFLPWSLLLMMMSVMSMLIFLNLHLSKNILIVEYFLMSFKNLDLKIYFLADWISMMFMSIVMFISSMVIFYSYSYMKMDKNKNSFCLIVLMFVMSMILLILMPNMFMIILGWDGLGLVSYCLVIHYQSINSYNSGMITIIMNRFGDIMMILALLFFLNFGTMDFLSLNKIELICGIMILTAGLTKSAQIPFSAWLPAAMAAPTPVSSLVHSSTLVTAGVYLLIRFNFFFKINFYSNILLKISLMTMLMAGINAFFENDFKKIIAFSTLSQLSLMMISIALGKIELAFFHLIMHAIFKSMLFLCAGLIIHSFQGIQDIRMLSNFFNVSPMISNCMTISILSLMGFPFIGGFYSKDMIMEFFFLNINNLILMVMFYMGVMFTFLYCMRLIYIILLKGTMNSFLTNFTFDLFMKIPIFSLCFTMIVLGSMMNWMMVLNYSLIFITDFCKFFTVFYLFIVSVCYFFIKKYYFMTKIMDFFMKIWYLNFISSYIMLYYSKKMMKISMSDWTWMELIGPSMINNNFSKFYQFNSWIELLGLMKFLLIFFVLIIMII
uniref:NADH-ubiquinone oxidoreductase chain 5 n=1 Tax=Amblyomma gervaisi TaxID=1987576 RepID=A0A977TPU9_9ACAR|nr:NADH dehydrogenase subunit 5 [Amblyomma gervaisi]UXX50154.1 NADH dehydrogenase subunit 5 [Amblyomma gervaisi]